MSRQTDIAGCQAKRTVIGIISQGLNGYQTKMVLFYIVVPKWLLALTTSAFILQ